MAVKKFIVTAIRKKTGTPPLFATAVPSPAFVLVVAGGPILAAILFQVSSGGLESSIAGIALVVMALLLLRNDRKQIAESTTPTTRHEEATITIYPIGVQLARIKNNRPVRPPLFIPRDVILDVIVNEVILAHKVVSIVLFRVWKRRDDEQQEVVDDDDNSVRQPPSISFLLKEGRIHLVPAFPGVEMSFAECHLMRRELSDSLGIL